jgi:hypothetical protein
MNPKLPRAPGALGEDGRSAGAADQNGSVSDRERSGESLSELGTGPKIGKNGEYLPAKYKQMTTFVTPAGPVSIEQTIEDR